VDYLLVVDAEIKFSSKTATTFFSFLPTQAGRLLLPLLAPRDDFLRSLSAASTQARTLCLVLRVGQKG